MAFHLPHHPFPDKLSNFSLFSLFRFPAVLFCTLSSEFPLINPYIYRSIGPKTGQSNPAVVGLMTRLEELLSILNILSLFIYPDLMAAFVNVND